MKLKQAVKITVCKNIYLQTNTCNLPDFGFPAVQVISMLRHKIETSGMRPSENGTSGNGTSLRAGGSLEAAPTSSTDPAASDAVPNHPRTGGAETMRWICFSARPGPRTNQPDAGTLYGATIT